MRFDLTDLRVFLHACEGGTMTQAASRSHLTLAAVSARIRALEEGVGVLLLRRHARGVTATPAGQALARHARLVFQQLDVLQRDLAQDEGNAPGHVLLLGNSSALARPMAHVIGAPLLLHPDARVTVRESASEVTVQALHAGSADLGIISDAIRADGLEAHDLGPDPLVLATRRDHPLAGRAAVAMPALLQEAWVAWDQGSALFTHLQMQAFRAGGCIRCKASVPTIDAALALVAMGAGISVLPAVLAQASALQAGVALVPLDESWARRRLLAVRKPGQGQALAAAIWDRLIAGWSMSEAAGAGHSGG